MFPLRIRGRIWSRLTRPVASVMASATAVAVAAGCGASPTVPSGSAGALPFVSGLHLVQFVGSDFVGSGSGPLRPGCPGISLAGFGVARTEAVVTSEAGVWRVRPREAAGGSFELRFSPGVLGGGAPGGGPGVVATAVGTAIATLAAAPGAPVPDSRVTFGEGATLTGGLSIDGRIGSGSVSGNVVFSNGLGSSVACNPDSVFWSLSKVG